MKKFYDQEPKSWKRLQTGDQRTKFTEDDVLNILDVEQYLRKYKISNINFNNLCLNNILPEYLIRQYRNYMNWKIISTKQYLSIDFMREFSKELNWIEGKK